MIQARGQSRRRRTSLGFAGLYALATLLAQGAHEHGEPRADERSETACDQPGINLDSHGRLPDLSRAGEHCPACPVRAAQALAVVPRWRVFAVGCPSPVDAPVLSGPTTLPQTLFSRGPPRV